MAATATPPLPFVVAPGGGLDAPLARLGTIHKVAAEITRGQVAIVEHTLPPRALAAPLHRHTREDELSIVLEGRIGALLGGHHVEAGAGAYVWKPRDEWHTFWNAGDTPCEIIELIAPPGFENFFREVAAAWGDMNAFAAINEKYALDMRFDSVPGLCERFGLTFPSL